MAQFPDDQCGVVVSKESLCVFCFSVALVYDYACVCYHGKGIARLQTKKDCGSKTPHWPVFVSESSEYAM